MFERVTDDSLKLSLYQLDRFLKMAKMLYTPGVLGDVCILWVGSRKWQKCCTILGFWGMSVSYGSVSVTENGNNVVHYLDFQFGA